jgi:hypothetical protein
VTVTSQDIVDDAVRTFGGVEALDKFWPIIWAHKQLGKSGADLTDRPTKKIASYLTTIVGKHPNMKDTILDAYNQVLFKYGITAHYDPNGIIRHNYTNIVPPSNPRFILITARKDGERDMQGLYGLETNAMARQVALEKMAELGATHWVHIDYVAPDKVPNIVKQAAKWRLTQVEQSILGIAS